MVNNSISHLASEWHEMMFAETRDVDFTNDDHLIMVLGENSIVNDICGFID